MNTKRKIAVALAVLMVAAALAVPAIADYSGDKTLTMYEHGMLNGGGIVYETVEDGTAYTQLPCNVYLEDPVYGLTQDITITIPEGKTVKMARLYNYVTYSTCDNDTKYTSGVPAEAELTFSDGTNTWTKTCVHGFADAEIADVPNPIYYGTDAVQYWDTKGPDYDCGAKYDYPSGTFAWDVTDMVTGNGVYTAKIVNADSTPTGMRPGKDYDPYKYRERFATWGFGLLVVYENDDPEAEPDTKYWITEGCDILLNTSKWGVYEPIATTNAPFDAKELKGKTATLTTVVMAPDKGDAEDWSNSMNMVYFNGLKPKNQIGPCTIDPNLVYPYTTRAIGVNNFDVQLKKKDNIAYFQDMDLGTGRGDNIAVSNAFLVTE